MFDMINSFWGSVLKVDKQDWPLKYEVIYESAVIRLLQFKFGLSGRARLVVPPMAGHHSNIAFRVVDLYCKETHDSVYAIEWKPASYLTKNDGIDEIVNEINECFESISEHKIHLSGLCQGGWSAAMHTALNPERVASLTIAGTPIDFKIDGGKIQSWLSMINDAFFDYIIACHGGKWPGSMQLTGFKMLNPVDRFFGTYLDLADSVKSKDEAGIKKWVRNNSWYEYVQDLPGKFIKQVIKRLFRGNELINGTFDVYGKIVDLKNIVCPVVCITGEDDDITLTRQCTEIFKYIGTLQSKTKHYHVDNCGHIGIFLKNESLDCWRSGLAHVNFYM